MALCRKTKRNEERNETVSFHVVTDVTDRKGMYAAVWHPEDHRSCLVVVPHRSSLSNVILELPPTYLTPFLGSPDRLLHYLFTVVGDEGN